MQKGVKEKDIRDFERYSLKIKSIMDRINKYNQEANIYVAENEVYLMGSSVYDSNGSPSQDNIVTSIHIGRIDGGGW